MMTEKPFYCGKADKEDVNSRQHTGQGPEAVLPPVIHV
jgi:hypothetical protein